MNKKFKIIGSSIALFVTVGAISYFTYLKVSPPVIPSKNARTVITTKVADTKIADAKVEADKVLEDAKIEAERVLAEAKAKADTKAREEVKQSPQPTDFTYNRYYNKEHDFTVLYPNFLTIKEMSATGGSIDLFSEDRKVDLMIGSSLNSDNISAYTDYMNAIKYTSGDIIYKKQADNWFVITSAYGDKITYTKEIVGKHSIVAITYNFPVKEKDKYKNVITKLEESFVAPSVDFK